jgi:hypothetical protein
VWRLPLRLCVLVAASCGSSGDSSPAAPPPPTFTSFGDAGALDGGQPECAEETRDIFVISDQRGFYSFNPPTLAFKKLGTLSCPTTADRPTSMAIDRHGTAWVRYSDGTLWRVSTRDLSCEKTSFIPAAEAAPFYQFGMGFSTSAKGDSNEQLYLSDSKGYGHARLDLQAMKVLFVGPYTGALANKRAELTGTGDGRLYGFFVSTPTSGSQIAEIAKATGSIVSVTDLPSVLPGDAYAFSFYGGDFYLYTHVTPDGGADAGGSSVTRVRPSDGSIEVVLSKVGFRIMGAGVSTCAPTDQIR